MSYRVEMTDEAYADLDRLMASLGETSASAADRLSSSFYEALTRLESFPFSCGLAYESPFFTEELRHLLFGIRK